MPKSANAYQPIRWSREDACKEFGIDRATLTKRMVEKSILPGDDDRYATSQITAAVFGDLAGEKLGKAKADREKAEIEAARAKGEAILASDAEMVWSDCAVRVRSTVEHA